MPTTVRHKLHNTYLGSPHEFGDGDQLWIWYTNQSNAHHFKDRADAKATLKRIDPRYVMKDFSFQKVA